MSNRYKNAGVNIKKGYEAELVNRKDEALQEKLNHEQ